MIYSLLITKQGAKQLAEVAEVDARVEKSTADTVVVPASQEIADATKEKGETDGKKSSMVSVADPNATLPYKCVPPPPPVVADVQAMPAPSPAPAAAAASEAEHSTIFPGVFKSKPGLQAGKRSVSTLLSLNSCFP